MVAIMLLLFGIILIIVNIKAINKDKNSFGNMLEYKVENMSELEEEIGQLRKDIAKEIYMKNITLEEYLSYKS